jgi:hypothetical protein
VHSANVRSSGSGSIERSSCCRRRTLGIGLVGVVVVVVGFTAAKEKGAARALGSALARLHGRVPAVSVGDRRGSLL